MQQAGLELDLQLVQTVEGDRVPALGIGEVLEFQLPADAAVQELEVAQGKLQ